MKGISSSTKIRFVHSRLCDSEIPRNVHLTLKMDNLCRRGFFSGQNMRQPWRVQLDYVYCVDPCSLIVTVHSLCVTHIAVSS